MMASAPSKIAVATSETSARVGRTCVTIDSSIWVATITGTLAARACRMISFWISGTSSSGTSTPRSPRAADDLLRRGPLDAELEHPVVHPDLVAGPDVREVLGVVQRGALGRALHGTRAQRERPAGDEVHVAPARRAEGAEADLRPLEVLEDRHGLAPARLALADQPDGRRALVGAAGREGEPRDAHARGDEPA